MASEVHERNTRLTNSLNVSVPSHKTNILKCSFIYNGSVTWNNLPTDLKLAVDLQSFKRKYKELVFNTLFDSNQ